MPFFIQIILFSLFLLISSSSFGQSKIEDGENHPLLTPYLGSQMTYKETIKFQPYILARGPITGYRYIELKDTLEGKVTRITYELKAAEKA